jgi:hypothetical protein
VLAEEEADGHAEDESEKDLSAEAHPVPPAGNAAV